MPTKEQNEMARKMGVKLPKLKKKSTKKEVLENELREEEEEVEGE